MIEKLVRIVIKVEQVKVEIVTLMVSFLTLLIVTHDITDSILSFQRKKKR
jgi:hypothetical protein